MHGHVTKMSPAATQKRYFFLCLCSLTLLQLYILLHGCKDCKLNSHELKHESYSLKKCLPSCQVHLCLKTYLNEPQFYDASKSRFPKLSKRVALESSSRAFSITKTIDTTHQHLFSVSYKKTWLAGTKKSRGKRINVFNILDVSVVVTCWAEKNAP